MQAHDWNKHSICTRCGLNGPEWMITQEPCIQNARVNVIDEAISNIKSALSCCGGKGGATWDKIVNQWKCTDCGAIKSNDPDFLFGGSYKRDTEYKPKEFWADTKKLKCTCGSASVGANRHSDYCDLYKKDQ
jgi:hypothetical protein